MLKGNRFTFCSGGPRVHGQGIGYQLSPCRSNLYCQRVKLSSTTGTVAKFYKARLKSILDFWFRLESGAIPTLWFLNSVTEWSQNLKSPSHCPAREKVLSIEPVCKQTGFCLMCWHWVSQPCRYSCLRKRKKDTGFHSEKMINLFALTRQTFATVNCYHVQ